MNDQAFTTGQVKSIADIPYRTIDYWARTGFLKPSIADANGTGTERLYSFRDIVALRATYTLRKMGLAPRQLLDMIRFIQKGPESLLIYVFPLPGSIVRIEVDLPAVERFLRRML